MASPNSRKGKDNIRSISAYTTTQSVIVKVTVYKKQHFLFISSVSTLPPSKSGAYKESMKDTPTRAATAALFFHEPETSSPAAAPPDVELLPEVALPDLLELPDLLAEPDFEAEPELLEEPLPDALVIEPTELLKESSWELSDERSLTALETPEPLVEVTLEATEPAREVMALASDTAPEVTVSNAPTAPEVTVSKAPTAPEVTSEANWPPLEVICSPIETALPVMAVAAPTAPEVRVLMTPPIAEPISAIMKVEG